MFIARAPRSAFYLGAAVALTTLVSFGSANAATFSIQHESGGSNQTATLGSSAEAIAGLSGSITITIFTSANDGCTPSCGNPNTGLFVNPGNSNLIFTYMGHSASDTDLAQNAKFGGTTLFNNQTSSNGATSAMSFAIGSGNALLPFAFVDTTGTDKTAPNGGPVDDGVSLGMYVSPDGQTAFLFFDDKNGGDQDHDYNDMVVKVTFANATPVPAALPLFASGLGAMGVLGWRRKRKLAA